MLDASICPRRIASSVTLLAVVALLTACGGGGKLSPTTNLSTQRVTLTTPKSKSPGTIAAPPMALSPKPPPMTSLVRPQEEIVPLGFTPIPGAALLVAASPDGTLWALGTFASANGADHSIYHYVNGAWAYIPGYASRLAAAPDGSLWAVNSAGGIYHYANGAWTPIGGGASDITVGADGSVYVVSSEYGNAYGNSIWHYANGGWNGLPGEGAHIAASWDPATYLGGAIAPGGFYVTNAVGAIYYFSPLQGYSLLPGSATFISPTQSGGVFALGTAAGPLGSSIYYNNLELGTWTQEPGAGIDLSTDGKSLYVVGVSGAIYVAPVVAGHPAPLTVFPTSLLFDGSSTPQTFSVSEIGYTGALSVSSSTPGVVSIVPATGAGPTQLFTVIPQGVGTTTLSVSDTLGQTGTPISVSVKSSAILLGGTLPLDIKGIGTPATFTAQENNYTGPLSASSSPAGIVNVTPSFQNGPGPVTFTVTSNAPGDATVTISDTNSQTASLNVVVTGPLVAQPSTLNFQGTTQAQTFAVNEANYKGPFTISSSDPMALIATVTPTSGTGPSASFSVTPVAKGSATFTISDSQGQSVTETVTVAPGPLTINGSSLNFVAGGSSATVKVSETNYTGKFSVSVTGSAGSVAVAPSSAAGPQETFTIAPTSTPGLALVTFTDDHGGTQSVSVAVVGLLTVSPSTVAPPANSLVPVPIQAYENVSQNKISETDTCSTIATVSGVAAINNGVSTWTGSVTPIPGQAGACSVNFSDGGSPSQAQALSVFITTETITIQDRSRQVR